MDKLSASRIAVDLDDFDYTTVKNRMYEIPWQDIQQINWPESYPDLPSVRFQIAHDDAHIFLHYRVQEDFVKAQHIRPNEAVYEDSCVEFFISFDSKRHYYNLEFNVLGTGLIGYGPAVKAERKRLSAKTIEQVSTATSVVKIKGNTVWAIILAIPTTIFEHDNIDRLSGIAAHANFYKCGDSLPAPHFVSWSPIDFPKPNFHLPEFFGDVVFE